MKRCSSESYLVRPFTEKIVPGLANRFGISVYFYRADWSKQHISGEKKPVTNGGSSYWFDADPVGERSLLILPTLNTQGVIASNFHAACNT